MKKKNLTAEEYSVLLAAIGQKDVLTVQEAAIFTGSSESFIYKLNHLRKLPRYQPNGKLCYYRKQDLLDWMQSNRIATSEEIRQQAINHIQTSARRAKA